MTSLTRIKNATLIRASYMAVEGTFPENNRAEIEAVVSEINSIYSTAKYTPLTIEGNQVHFNEEPPVYPLVGIEPVRVYVLGQYWCRGDQGMMKFRVFKSDVEQALQLYSQGPDGEHQTFLDAIREKYPAASVFGEPYLFEALVSDFYTSLPEVTDLSKGFIVEQEEAAYGIGLTKEAAEKAFMEWFLGHDMEGGWD